MKIFEDITKIVGHTPLVRIRHMLKGSNVDLVAKLESFNSSSKYSEPN